MAAPHFKSASNHVMLVWDDTAKDFVVWDGSVSGGYDTVWIKNVAGTKINPATEETVVNIEDKIGEAQDVPTQYTLNDRLKTINESINVVYAIQYAVDSGDSTITYVGKATTGSTLASAVWQIKKITDTSGDLSIQFADGNTNFDNVWNNRESLSYS